MEKFNYSLNDHYKWGFNDNWFNAPEPDGWFQVSIGSCNRPHKSFREECIIAAKLLGENITKPIMVGLSGGYDSQVVCLSLMSAGVPFTPVVLQLFNHDGMIYNKYDNDGAFAFCKKHGLVPVVEKLNLNNYYVNELPKLVEAFCITSAEIVVQLYLVKKYQETHAYINGGGDPILLKTTDPETGIEHTIYQLGPTPIEQYLIENNLEGCLKFFMYTPEQIAAYLNHPIFHYYNNIRSAIDDKSGYTFFTYCVKTMMYTAEWPELLVRKKYTGFEKIPYMKKVQQVIGKMNEHINPKSKMVIWKYEEILDHLLANTGEIKTFRSLDDRNYYG